MALSDGSSSSVEERQYDVAIVGGGIIGLSTAMQLLERSPDLNVAVIEKEEQLAQHQTGHNSGVIHSGIYLPSWLVEVAVLRGREGQADPVLRRKRDRVRPVRQGDRGDPRERTGPPG